jgi:hypothetical protein
MGRRRTARELEQAAAAGAPPRPPEPAPPSPVLAMLARRGLRTRPARPDLPFPPALDPARAEALCHRLDHYAFRLFLRGAIQRPEGFAPSATTRYLSPEKAREHAEFLVGLSLAERLPRGRYRLVHPARSFGGTLEWYVARELSRRLGFDVATGLKLGARGVGGDLDVVAVADGRLVYLELKSSPPRQLEEGEVAAFVGRIRAVRPDLSLLVLDTGLRLADKVVPMLVAAVEASRRGARPEPRRVARESWAITPLLFAVNAKPNLVANVGRAISEGLLALAPPPP